MELKNSRDRFLFLFIFLIFVMFISFVQALNNAEGDKFIIIGTLIYEDGTPANGIDIGVAEVNNEDGTIIKIKDGKFEWAGIGKTDSKGNFSCVVDRDYFKDNTKFTIVLTKIIKERIAGLSGSGNISLPAAMSPGIEDSGGGKINFEIDDKTSKLNLNKIIGKITVPNKYK